jgi:hypothetical protein
MKLLGAMKLFVLLVGVVCTACVPQIARPQAPQVELLQFGLLSLDPFSGRAEFDVRLRLTNGNTFALPLLESSLTAELAGSGFRFTLPAVDIAAGGSREIQARLSVPVVEGTQALSVLVSGQSTRLRLLGELRVQLGPATVPIGPVTLVDRPVQISLNFTLPQLQITGIRLEGLSLVVGIQGSNSNIIGFALQGPMRLNIGAKWARPL